MNHQTPKLIYLASPYSHPDQHVREDRFELATMATAFLMRQGFSVFSPIAHSHHVGDYLPEELLMDHEFWMRQDLPWLRTAGAVFVLRLDGWEDSRGVREEIQQARHHGIRVSFCDLVFDGGKPAVRLEIGGSHDQTGVAAMEGLLAEAAASDAVGRSCSRDLAR